MKKSSSALAEMEQNILTMTQEKPKGISDGDISQKYPDLEPAQKAAIINKLLSQGKIGLFRQGATLLYKFKDVSKSQAKGDDREEKIVCAIIEETGNKGAWTRDIKSKSNLTQVILNKTLKSLETKKIIKTVRSVSASKKKLYMMYNIEPDDSVTGGAWYQDQEFEAEFVDVLNQQCFRYLEQKKENAKGSEGGPIAAKLMTYASSDNVCQFISNLGISKVTLSVKDIEVILNTLVYDGKVEKTIGKDGKAKYRTIQSPVKPPGLIKSPCGLCPVRQNCSDFGDVTPQKCQYFSDWLNTSKSNI